MIKCCHHPKGIWLYFCTYSSIEVQVAQPATSDRPLPLPSCPPWPSCRCGRAAAKLLLPPRLCQAAAAALLPLPLPPPWPRCRQDAAAATKLPAAAKLVAGPLSTLSLSFLFLFGWAHKTVTRFMPLYIQLRDHIS